jgi:hypothetical protein
MRLMGGLSALCTLALVGARLMGALLPPPAWIATGQADGRIAVLDGRRGLAVTVIRDGALCDEIYARCGDVWSPGLDAFVYVQLDPLLPSRPLALAVFDLVTGQSRVIRADPTLYNPVWLPDGDHLAYFARRDFRNPGEANLYLHNLQDGSERLLYGPVSDRTLEAAPDGTRLALVTHQHALIVFDLATGTARQLAQPAFEPRWSPDGAWLTYVGITAADSDIYRIRPDGGGQQRLSQTSAEDDAPAWIGGGQRVIFTGLRMRSYGPDYNLYTIAPDGTDRQRLFIPRLSYPDAPMWHSALGAVVFTARWRGQTDLYSIRLDGRGLRPLTVGGVRNASLPEG